MAITSTTARADIFKEFFSVIKTNLTTPNVKVTNSFVEDVAEIPQVVINPPSLPRNRLAFGTATGAYDRSGDLEIEVYGNSTKQVVELLDDVENAIFSNLSDLSVQNIEIGEGSIATIESGGKQVRVIVIPLAFKFVR
jgi:hypothetical protein